MNTVGKICPEVNQLMNISKFPLSPMNNLGWETKEILNSEFIVKKQNKTKQQQHQEQTNKIVDESYTCPSVLQFLTKQSNNDCVWTKNS